MSNASNFLTKNAEDDCVSSDPELQAGWLSIVRVVVEGGEVLQGGAVAELVLVLCLHHGGPLRAERPHGLEDVHHALVLHPLQHDAQGDEHTRPPNASAVNRGYFFASLFRYFVTHLTPFKVLDYFVYF